LVVIQISDAKKLDLNDVASAGMAVEEHSRILSFNKCASALKFWVSWKRINRDEVVLELPLTVSTPFEPFDEIWRDVIRSDTLIQGIKVSVGILRRPPDQQPRLWAGCRNHDKAWRSLCSISTLRHLAPEHLRSGRSMRAKVQRSGRPASSYSCAPSLDTVPLAHDTPATSN
jgi:hypothetical protein